MLDLAEGETLTFHVVRWEEGDVTIHPRHQPEGKTIRALRVWVRPADKPDFPPYWDFTATKLVAQLRPMLPLLQSSGRRVTLTARGLSVKRVYALDLSGA